MQHILSGTLTLNLTRPIVTVNTSNSGSSIISGKPGSGPGPNSNSVNGHVKISLLGYQKIIIAHAIISSFGFLFILPTGVLLARYLRTFTSKWYKIHWIIQFGIGESRRLNIACSDHLSIHSRIFHHFGGIIRNFLSKICWRPSF